MLTAGIIAEFNPFHNGHAFLINTVKTRLRELSSDIAVVCIMSGNFVQRGDFSIMRKHARAKSAVLDSDCGADLIIELPLPFSCASAEFFAQNAVRLLDALGVVDFLAFGSEAGEISGLSEIAKYLTCDAANTEIRQKDGESFAVARENAVKQALPELAHLLRGANNILAIEYLKAIRILEAKLKPMTVRREKTLHDAAKPAGNIASASLIRTLLLENNPQAFLYMPKYCEEIIKEEIKFHRAPVDIKNCERALLSHYRKADSTHFAKLPDATEGLNNRLMHTAQNAVSLDEIIRKTGTKRYPDSRIRRMLLFSYLGISEDMLKIQPQYIRVLAANKKGIAVLREIKKKCILPVITKPAHGKKLPGLAKELFLFSVKATDLYTLAYPKLCHGGGEWTENIQLTGDDF